MKFGAALSTRGEVDDLTEQIRARLGPSKIDLALIFIHPDLVTNAPDFARDLRATLGARHLVGCTGAGIIGEREECEEHPAVSVLAASLPEVEITPFHLSQEEIEESPGPNFWHFHLDVEPDSRPNFLLFPDPFSLHPVGLLQSLAEAYPGAPIVGGLASGARAEGENRLFVDDTVHDAGVVGLALTGRIELRTIVSQGCRPIGQPLTVTRAEKNIVFELAGEPPMVVLQKMLPKLSPADQKLARSALFLGSVINEYQEDFGRGDFLIRNLIGHDPNSGALAIGDWMRTGQTVQFQVRDSATAAEDLESLLDKERERPGHTPAAGAVLFSCLGRGERMYGIPNHDIAAIQRTIGPVPTAGFFANGEIGPVGNRPFVHGFTSVIGLFSDPQST